ncbi:hypothetical protein GQ457_15G016060 [Hibiscus cannabinus]
MCMAVKMSNVDGRALNVDISGCMVLLQSWAWYRLPFLAPICAVLSEFPLATRWHHKKQRKALEHKVTVEVRMLIDLCCESQFIWRPYLDEDVFGLIPNRAFDDVENCNGHPRRSSGSGSSSSVVGGSSSRCGSGLGCRGRRARQAAPEAEPEPQDAPQMEEVEGMYGEANKHEGNFENCYVPHFSVSEPQFFVSQPVDVEYMTSVMGTTSLSSHLLSTGVGGAGPSMFRTPRRINVESREDSDDEESGEVRGGVVDVDDDDDAEKAVEARVQHPPRHYENNSSLHRQTLTRRRREP